MDTEKQFVIGFNNGYLIAKHEPSLSTKITKNLEPTPGYLEGFISGKEEYEVEQSIRQEEELKNIRNRSQDRGIDLDMV